eukprot:CAMPEP_0119345044 /NCGR_PEP_ID=MMETSP1333-20130426/107282_1 /TAXON_ID=418940 /ORGANISM="Scyphosphaera apsteinii, Strain RCC1455" /LENGTH=199 /DNA_ID=CAMNT_0007357497 /DNA_START=442 /DNA_END=1041 /DNA_ORIENTATION=-
MAIGFVGASFLVMYGFYRISLRVMKFFLHVPPNQIFMFGLVVGAITATAGLGALTFVRGFIHVHPDGVYAAALKELRKHPKVEEALGGFWRPGSFRGHALESFEDALTGGERRVRSSYFEMPAQRVQMIFQVKGAAHDGIVSLESYKRRGTYHFEMLALDVNETAEHLLVVGSKDRPLFSEIVNILDHAKKSGKHTSAD